MLLTACLVAACGRPAPAAERAAVVAGKFYPGDRAGLEAAIDGALARADTPLGPRPVALVAPHAGYIFCGDVLAEAWRQAKPHRYDLIVILGTNHTAAGFEKVAVWTEGAWRTPLGTAAVDQAAATALLAADPKDCTGDPGPHLREHSIEVQIPFAARLFPGVPILPAVVGTEDLARCERFGKALAAVVRGRRALIIASSDLSHYPAKTDAEAVDRAVLAAMTTLDPATVKKTIAQQMERRVPGLSTCACGEAPILAAMAAARALGATRGALLCYANSGDVPYGDPREVVGYGAVAFTAEEMEKAPSAEPRSSVAPISPAGRQALLALARDSIRARCEGAEPPPTGDCPAELAVRRGAFVTLRKGGELRGCIGHMAEDMPLCAVVGEMAQRAAFADARFPPLRRQELPLVTIEISVLTPARHVPGPSAIVVGRDGVILRKRGHSAVFLPQVATEQGWDRETMLAHLAAKAGLDPDAWRSGAELLTFQAEVFGEAEVPADTPAAHTRNESSS